MAEDMAEDPIEAIARTALAQLEQVDGVSPSTTDAQAQEPQLTDEVGESAEEKGAGEPGHRLTSFSDANSEQPNTTESPAPSSLRIEGDRIVFPNGASMTVDELYRLAAVGPSPYLGTPSSFGAQPREAREDGREDRSDEYGFEDRQDDRLARIESLLEQQQRALLEQQRAQLVQEVEASLRQIADEFGLSPADIAQLRQSPQAAVAVQAAVASGRPVRDAVRDAVQFAMFSHPAYRDKLVSKIADREASARQVREAASKQAPKGTHRPISAPSPVKITEEDIAKGTVGIKLEELIKQVTEEVS
jgi:hypothetical protein